MKFAALAAICVCATLGALATPVSIQAQQGAQPAPPQREGWIGLGVGGSALTDGYDSWRTVQLRAFLPVGRSDALNAELLRAHRFDESGTYVVLGDTHSFGDDWALSLSGAHGFDGFFFPELRFDGTLERSFLDGDFRTRVGYGYIDYKDAHFEHSALLGATWYPAPEWVTQADVRFQRSSPGSVWSRQQSLALTRIFPASGSTVAARLGFGRTAYDPLLPATDVTEFATREASLIARHPISPGWGTEVHLDYFHSPLYDRGGLTVGVFRILR